MKIYFAASIRGGRDEDKTYKKIIKFLKKDNDVLTEHVGNTDLTAEGETKLSDKEIRDRDIAWLEEADVMVADTTNPSLGVGYELAYAEKLHKPVVILHNDDKSHLSAMISGSDYFLDINNYSTYHDAIQILDSKFSGKKY
ncbi:nucleoside 2-deoxyribosyltransferase [Companilactobacillus ginsenosidimutans]|uniref:Putative 2'-deoxynucleoside 5'-phosphate N-hydrolase 1 n=1 Tax=Companilactobacillus ginsenosidimutans TaxID=1007676 RepID=A0A0H4QEC7_9LACO|nr:nucleoside 2-deoxyribosyltransferase [Companilactobacillus ginsenosidimutans]AKP66292.1 nucleoside 2-deoxyribosyltransferase [Companilactobacillus ginsenosidimutans]